MLNNYRSLALALVLLSAAGFAGAQESPAPNSVPNYSDLQTWLCHPDNKADACDRDLTTTVLAADGSMTREAALENANPEIDCFYVYPTTSMDEMGNSDLMPHETAEIITAHLQTARLRAHCRVFAPVYRQVTVPALRSAMQGKPMGDRAMPYNDVLSAWQHYINHENKGRGFVIVGHSQGAGLINRLIASEIDGQPLQNQLVSVITSGTSISVPKDAVVGGTFKHIPLCEAADQIGCVITFSTYRDRIPPPDNALFARGMGENLAGCTNPAALKGGKAELHAYLSTFGEITPSHAQYTPWTSDGKTIDTPFVSLPGMIFGECVTKGPYTYLEISVKGDPSDPRLDDIIGDLYSGGGSEINKGWGLHLIDMGLVMGNLVDVVGQQAKRYSQR